MVTFAPMFLMDVSLNIMSLGGLALGVGMLVDNAIVVLESITRAAARRATPCAAAAVRGVAEVAGAITASTLTTVSVFAPIVFVQGIAGQIFGDQAVTVVSSLLVSLLVAVLFIPMLASRPLADGARGPLPQNPRLDRRLGAREAAQPRRRAHRAPRVYAWRFARDWVTRGLGGAQSNALRAGAASGTLRLGCLGLFLALRVGCVLIARRRDGRSGSLRGHPAVQASSFDALLGCRSTAVYPQLLALRAARAPLLIIAAVSAFLGWFAFERAKGLGLELMPGGAPGRVHGLPVGLAGRHTHRGRPTASSTASSRAEVADASMGVNLDQPSRWASRRTP